MPGGGIQLRITCQYEPNPGTGVVPTGRSRHPALESRNYMRIDSHPVEEFYFVLLQPGTRSTVHGATLSLKTSMAMKD